MPRRKKYKYKKMDYVQGVGSLWAVMLGILFLGDRAIFYQFLILSLIAAGLVLALVLIVRKRRFGHIFKWSADQKLLAKLRNMKPDEFEDFVADLYSRLGYATDRVGGSHDGGVDVTAKKNGVLHYIQCKKYINSKATLRDARDFYGAMWDKLADGKGIFITTNIFTTDAVNFADNKPIELIDGFKLLKLIKQAGKK